MNSQTTQTSSTAPAPTIHAFVAGRHVDSNGRAADWSEADLQELADSYDPKLSEAPICVGHAKGNTPAYGWIGAVRRTGPNLYADPSTVQPEFQDWVKRKLYKKVSLSIYGREHPNNPVPGKLYLRHVAFLGAQPPAIKGLADTEFNDGAEHEHVIEFGDWSDEQVASLFGRLRDWFIASFGLEKADTVLPSYAIDSLKREAMAPPSPAPAPAGLNYSDAGAPAVSTLTQEQLATQAAELQTQRQALDARDAELRRRETETQRAAQRTAVASFAEGLVRSGKLLPAHRPAVVELMASLPADAAALEFNEGDQAVKKAPLQVLQDFLTALPVQVDFSERAAGDKDGKTTTTGVDTSDGQAIARAALEYQEAESKAGRTVSLEAAVSHIVYSNQEA